MPCHLCRLTRRRYEWEQSIDELLLYIKTPPGVRVHALAPCKFFLEQLID